MVVHVPPSRNLAFAWWRRLAAWRGGVRASALARVLGVLPMVLVLSGWMQAEGLAGNPSKASAPVLIEAPGESTSALQASPLSIRPQAGTGAPVLTLGAVLETEGVRSSLESGLPVRIRIVTELWRSRTFDALDGRHEWRASLYLDPLSGRYVVETGEGERREVVSLPAARSFLQEGLAPPLAPARGGTFYYLARMEVETLSLSDLDELRRWLRGDLGPAVEGREEVGSALGRGLRRLLVRALRLPVERYETRSGTFTR